VRDEHPPTAKTSRAKTSRTKTAKCPICGKPVVLDYRPFCSKRCADIDLGRWLGGRYAVPGEPVARGLLGEADEDAGPDAD
jgi:endogenous inhibitor of DNA gyrase (YacG/DUF329 family)